MKKKRRESRGGKEIKWKGVCIEERGRDEERERERERKEGRKVVVGSRRLAEKLKRVLVAARRFRNSCQGEKSPLQR